MDDGFTTAATDEAILKLQRLHDDVQASVQLNRDITANPDVQAAENIAELFISNIDDTAPADYVLQCIRNFYSSTQAHDGKYYARAEQLSLLDLAAEKAVLSCTKLEPWTEPSTGRTKLRGCARVEVANSRVADLLCSFSFDPPPGQSGSAAGSGVGGINCAPPGRTQRQIGIRRSRRRRDDQSASDSTLQRLQVARISVVDVDARECPSLARWSRLSPGAPPECPARTLWEMTAEWVRMHAPHAYSCNRGATDFGVVGSRLCLKACARPRPVQECSQALTVAGTGRVFGSGCRCAPMRPAVQAGIRLLSRAIEVRRDGVAQLLVDLRTIKHIKPLECADGREFLALRLRRPPTVNTRPGLTLLDTADDAAAAPPSSGGAGAPLLPRAADTTTLEAFASPTAYLCLHFFNPAGCRNTHAALKQFRLNIHRDVQRVVMHGSRHERVCGGVSHRLPPTLAPLTDADFAAVGDTEHAVAFLLDLLLRHGHLRAADVPTVLGMLRRLCTWGAVRSYEVYLDAAANNLPPFHRGNEGDALLNTVRAVHAVTARRRRCRTAVRGLMLNK